MDAWRVAQRLDIELDDLLDYLVETGMPDATDVTPLTDEQVSRIKADKKRIVDRSWSLAGREPSAVYDRPVVAKNSTAGQPQEIPPTQVQQESEPRREPGPQVDADPLAEVWAEVFRDAERPILLWGPPASGKSTFLQSMLLPDWGANLQDATHRWEVSELGLRTASYVGALREAYERGTPPPATSTTEPPYKFRIRKVKKARRLFGIIPIGDRTEIEANMLFLDPSGELFTVARMSGQTGERVLRLFGNAAGLLLLIDPTPSAPDASNVGDSGDDTGAIRQHHNEHLYSSMLSQNIAALVHWAKTDPDRRARMLDGQNRLTIPTAVCVTKMDQHLEHQNNVSAFLRQQLGNAYDMLQHSFTEIEVWGCSALGNDVRMSEDGKRMVGSPKPWKIFEPLGWLMDRSRRRKW